MRTIIEKIITPVAHVEPKMKPIYRCPISYCKNNNKIIMYWGLRWFYFKQLFLKKQDGNLGRFCWLEHLKLNLLHFILLPYIIINNKIIKGETGLIR